MATRLVGTSFLQEIDSSNNAQVNLPGVTSTGVNRGGGSANGLANFSEVDAGTVTASRLVMSPEVDSDYRLRASIDTVLDCESFNYTAQNTGKFQYNNTSMVLNWAASGLQSNFALNNSTAVGNSLRTYASFPAPQSGQTQYITANLNLTAQPTANVALDFGLFLQPTSNPFVPTDGIYFRVDSAGVKGVINNNGTELETLLTFTYANNQVYYWVIATNAFETLFYIDNILYARVNTPIAQGSPYLSEALPYGLRQANVGAAGAAFSAFLKNYSISLGGGNYTESLGQRGNAMYGSYQGISGGTMGSLSTYTNSTNPTAAVASNTVLTANLPAGLGGQAWETFSLALTTDGILLSYQVPAGTVLIPGKRLKITGVKLSSYVQTVLAGGPQNRTFTLNYGHTAASLATAEAATTKARRVVLLPELTQAVTAAQAVNTMISQPGGCVSMFPEPIYVNPGEFVSLSVKGIGTVGTSGTIATNIQYIYSWE